MEEYIDFPCDTPASFFTSLHGIREEEETKDKVGEPRLRKKLQIRGTQSIESSLGTGRKTLSDERATSV